MKKKSKKNQSSVPDDQSFEDALQSLRGIVSDLEAGELGLEESMQRFEEGTKLLRTCYSTLEQAEQKIEILTRISDDGELETKPFDATATADIDAQKRSNNAQSTTDKDSDKSLF